MQNRLSFNARKTKKKLGEKRMKQETKNEYAHEEDSMLTGQR